MNSCSLVFPELSLPFPVVDDDWCPDAELAAGFVRVSRVFAKFPLSSIFSVSTAIESSELSAIFEGEVVLTFVRLLLLIDKVLAVEESVSRSTVSLLVHVFSFLIA